MYGSLLSSCISFFVGCLLIYLGVQLLQSVSTWLIAGLVMAGIFALVTAIFRWRRERW